MSAAQLIEARAAVNQGVGQMKSYQRLSREYDQKVKQLQRACRLCERLQAQVEDLRFLIWKTERGAREYRDQSLALLESIS